MAYGKLRVDRIESSTGTSLSVDDIASGVGSTDVDTAQIIATGSTTERSIADHVGNVIDVRNFGATTTADSTQAILAAVNYAISLRNDMEWATGPKVVGNGTFPVSDLTLPAFANIDLSLTNADTTSTVVQINGWGINLNDTTVTPSSDFTGWCYEIDDTRDDAAGFYSRLSGNIVTADMQAGSTRLGKFFRVNITKSACAFWDVKRFRSMYCSKGFVVNAESSSDSAYFNSNEFVLEPWGFIDEPLVLGNAEGATVSEVSANTITVELQPSSRTIDGIKLYGGLRCKRNKISGGELWDWSPVFASTGNLALLDRGFQTTIEGVSSTYVQQGYYSNFVSKDVQVQSSRTVLVPTNEQDFSIIGHQDNVLAFADRRTNDYTISSDAFDYGTASRIFSLDTYNGNGWDVTGSTERQITIEYASVMRLTHISASFMATNCPAYVKIETKNSSGIWGTIFETSNNYQAICGYYSPYSTGTGADSYGIRYTFADPRSITTASEREPEPSQGLFICGLYAVNRKNQKTTTYVQSYNPTIYGSLRTNNTIPSTEIGTKVASMPIYDVTGSLIGYVPIYS